MSTHVVYIALGSNMPDSEARGLLRQAMRLMQACLGGTGRCSAAVATRAIGMDVACTFINQVAVFTTQLGATDVAACLKQIERRLGRRPSDKTDNVVRIDLDLLKVDDTIMRPLQMEWPHVAAAMAELDGGMQQ